MRARRHVPLAALLVAVTALAACTSAARPTPPRSSSSSSAKLSPSASASTSSTPQRITFVNCTRQIQPSLAKKDQNRVGRLSFFCGRLNVPLNYAQPDGRTTQLYVVRIHDNSQVHRTGSLIVNPGGPGSSGVGMAIDLATSVSDDLLQHFDLVGFDPRGVFLSSALSCLSAAQKDQMVGLSADVRSSSGYAAALRFYASIAASCSKKYGRSLQYYDTVSTVRDLDLVRQGVGDTQLNYLGADYGSLLGAVYARLFPEMIRVAVLDGPIASGVSVVSVARSRLRAAEAAFGQFAAACRALASCAALGDPRSTVPALIRRLDARPLQPTNPADHRRVTGAYVVSAVTAALADRGRWDNLRGALISARAGNPTGLLALADGADQRDATGHFTNLLDAGTVITCNDAPGVPTKPAVQALARIWSRQYPVFGKAAAQSLVQCIPWQAPRHPVPSVAAAGSVPILVVGTRYDPQTPYPTAVALANELKTGVVLTWNGQGHTAYPKTKCVRSAVDNYLISATAPPAGVSCPAQ
jgi:pimeloyl-ACP methyl ester carboxylesterase